MNKIKRTAICLQAALLTLIASLPVLAADDTAPQNYVWGWSHVMPWRTVWWIFPLLCLLVFFVMLFFLMSTGGMGCMWHGKPIDGSHFDRSGNQPPSDASVSALQLLNERYAKGEI